MNGNAAEKNGATKKRILFIKGRQKKIGEQVPPQRVVVGERGEPFSY